MAGSIDKRAPENVARKILSELKEHHGHKEHFWRNMKAKYSQGDDDFFKQVMLEIEKIDPKYRSEANKYLDGQKPSR